MDNTEIIEVAREAVLMVIEISMPVMMVGLVVGVVIALIQALTQIQEMTLVFVPKMIAIFFSIFLFFPGFTLSMSAFMERIADRIVGGG